MSRNYIQPPYLVTTHEKILHYLASRKNEDVSCNDIVMNILIKRTHILQKIQILDALNLVVTDKMGKAGKVAKITPKGLAEVKFRAQSPYPNMLSFEHLLKAIAVKSPTTVKELFIVIHDPKHAKPDYLKYLTNRCSGMVKEGYITMAIENNIRVYSITVKGTEKLKDINSAKQLFKIPQKEHIIKTVKNSTKKPNNDLFKLYVSFLVNREYINLHMNPNRNYKLYRSKI